VFLLLSLEAATASSVSLWLNLETVGTAVLAWLFFKEDMGVRAWIATALVVSGGLLLALPFEAASMAALAWIAAAALCWGLDNNVTSLIDGLTPAQSTLVKGIVAGSVNLGLGLSIEGPLDLGPEGVQLLLASLAVGGLGYGLSIALYVRSAQHLGATRSQLIFAAAPFLGLVLSWFIVGEEIRLVHLVAGAGMAVGITLMMKAKHSHHHVHESMVHTHSHRHDDGHHNHEHPGQDPSHRHTHEHEHEPMEHDHIHRPDLHHRHDH
jgi:drug/metabolite transporter (DMT)-like permease